MLVPTVVEFFSKSQLIAVESEHQVASYAARRSYAASGILTSTSRHCHVEFAFEQGPVHGSWVALALERDGTIQDANV